MANLNGTNVAAAVRPFSDADTFPTAHANEILGGHHTAATVADMYTIPSDRREVGMLCAVIADNNVYKLTNNPVGSDTTASDWAVISGVDSITVAKTSEDPTKIPLQEKLNSIDDAAATRFMYFIHKGVKTGDNEFELVCPTKAKLVSASIVVPSTAALTETNTVSVQYLNESGVWTPFAVLDIDSTDDNHKENTLAIPVEIPAGTRIRCEMTTLEDKLSDFHIIVGLKTIE